MKFKPHFRDSVRFQPITGLYSVFHIREDQKYIGIWPYFMILIFSLYPISGLLMASLIDSRRDRYYAFCNNIDQYCEQKLFE